MRPAQAIKLYHQPYIHSNLQSFSRQFPWDALGGPEKDRVLCVCGEVSQVHSPWILLASWMSLGKMVTCLAWMVQRLVSLNNPMRQPPGVLAAPRIGIAFPVPLQLQSP